MSNRLVIFFFLLSFCKADYGQLIFKFETEYQQTKKNRRSIPPSDTLHMYFDYDYKNDVVTIKTKGTTYTSDSLNAENVFGFGGKMAIPKKYLRNKVDLYFNNIKIASLRLDLKYSVTHLEYDKQGKKFTLRYIKYRAGYL